MFLFGLLAVCTIVLITLAFQSSSIGVSLVLSFILGVLLSFHLGQQDRNETKSLLKVFFVTFTVYLLYSSFIFMNLKSGEFILFPDQYHFYEEASSLGKFGSLKQIFYECFISDTYSESEITYFLFGSIAYLSNMYLDGNSNFLQSIWVSIFAVLISLFVFKILRNYVNSQKALYFTFLYAFLTGVFFYSPWLLRDIHISLLYVIGLYLIHTNFSLKRLLLFIPLIIIISGFRLENGLFSLSFPVVFLYLKGRDNQVIKKIWPIVVFIFLSLGVGISGYFLPKFLTAFETIERYQQYSVERASDGLSEKLYSLPIGISETSRILYSQIAPLPPWNLLEQSESFLEGVVGGINFITTVFWAFLFIFLVVTFLYKPSFYRNLPKSLGVLLILTLLFLLFNSSNIITRRILAMYPILLVTYAYLETHLNSKVVFHLKIRTVQVYLSLLILFFFLKYLI